MKKYKAFFTPEELEEIRATHSGKRITLNKKRNYLTSDELNKFASINVSNNPVLQECQLLFMEQVFCSCHDEEMVPKFALDTYHLSIGRLLIRAGIACNYKLIAHIIPELGFRTSANVIGKFHFTDNELSNAKQPL